MFISVMTRVLETKNIYPAALNKAYRKFFHFKYPSTFGSMRPREDSGHGNNQVQVIIWEKH